jgi:aminopeptidase N
MTLGEQHRHPARAPQPAWPRDVHSYARPAEARVTHVELDLVADFDRRQLRGWAALDIAASPAAREIVLDTRDLAIRAVTDAGGRPLPFALGTADPVLGQPLHVAIGGATTRVVVSYSTSPSAAALQWFAPDQTLGGRHPFLFTQGQAILARTWVPTQDSPGVRQTYDAGITIPAGLVAVMSAERLTPDGEPAVAPASEPAAAPDGGDGMRAPPVDSRDGSAGGWRRFRFRMSEPVPAYLFALAVGDLAFRPIGPRTGVFAEPALLERAAYEFADLERMLHAAESVGGPYRWGRFDVLVPPPSFPYGGMENPRLAFVTPTLIVGDRSLTTVVAHELAHGWAGNLVTPATWSDFWLNEGFTVYMELRIIATLYGAERAAMLEVHGYRELAAELARMGATSPDTRLHVDLAGRDPAEGVTVIPYVKGAAFLRAIEREVGRERLDLYLRSWFDRHAFTSVTTEAFVRDLEEQLSADAPGLGERVGFDEWLYAAGLPGNVVQPESDALRAVDAQAAAFVGGAAGSSLRAASWTPQEWRHFLNSLPGELAADRLAELDATFALSESANSEVLFAWLRLATRSRYEPALPTLRRFVTAQGRGKFVIPLYRDLMATSWGQDEARRVYAEARPRYHALVTTALDAIVR